MKWMALLPAVVLGAGSAASQAVEPTHLEVAFQEVAVGRIVGAEYFPEWNELALYAEPSPRRTTLHVEQISQLGQAMMQCSGRVGFSLEFERKAESPFTRRDLLDERALAAKLQEAADPVSRLVRSRLDPQALHALASEAGRDQLSGRLRKSLLRALNNLVQDPGTAQRSELEQARKAAASAVPPGDVLSPARLHRILIEDAFAGTLRTELGPRYQIRYKPPGCEEILQRILNSTQTERTLLITDSFLKDAAYGTGVPLTLNLGAGQAELCAEELENWVQAGRSLEEYPRKPFVVFLDLEVESDFNWGSGFAVAFRRARLTVGSGGVTVGEAAPPCVQRFARGLTVNLPKVLADDSPLGAEYRTLEALLLTVRALAWARDRLAVPFDAAAAPKVQAQVFSNTPPKLEQFPLVIEQRGKVSGFVYEGGVWLGAPFAPAAAPMLPGPQAQAVAGPRARVQSPPTTGAPGFIVTNGEFRGMRLLKIDVSSILGLEPWAE